MRHDDAATYATCSAEEVAAPPMIRLAGQYAALKHAPDREVVEWSGERYREEWFG